MSRSLTCPPPRRTLPRPARALPDSAVLNAIWAEPKLANPRCRNAARAAGEFGAVAGRAGVPVLSAAEVDGAATAVERGADDGLESPPQAVAPPASASQSRTGAKCRTRETLPADARPPCQRLADVRRLPRGLRSPAPHPGRRVGRWPPDGRSPTSSNGLPDDPECPGLGPVGVGFDRTQPRGSVRRRRSGSAPAGGTDCP